MREPKILKCYIANDKNIERLKFDFDPKGERPAWIHVKNAPTKARFLAVRTEKNAEEVYKRFTGNFYYPINFTPEEEKRFYAQYAQFYDKYTAKNNLPMAKFLLSKMIKLKIRKEAKILDIGAGTGIFSDLAAKHGFTSLTLLDISQTMLNVARSKPSLKKAKFIKGNVIEIKLQDNYDVFVSIMLFDALDDKTLLKALQNLTKNLKQKGHIFLIEDKHRKAYDQYFNKIEDGFFYISKQDNFAKYHFIGERVDKFTTLKHPY